MNVLEYMDQYNRRDRWSLLNIMDVESGEIETVLRLRRVFEAPNWTVDGRALIVNSMGRLHRFELESRTLTEIPTGVAIHCNNDHVLSADGKWLALSDNSHEDGQSRIRIVPVEGGEPRLVTRKAPSYLHGWSPDGSTLAYCAERGGQYDIWTIPASCDADAQRSDMPAAGVAEKQMTDATGGCAETQLTNTPGLDDGPEYAPDGRHIWFNSTRSGLMQIWRMGADGSDPIRMFDSESNDWFPHVSPDGQKVVYVSYRKGDVEPGAHPPDKQVEIRLASSAGGEWRTLVRLFGGQGTMNVNSWAPDSRRFAFVSYEMP